MAVVTNCEYCGAKPGKGGKVSFHKKGCPELKHGVNREHRENKSGDIMSIKIPGHLFQCCGQPLRRTNGGPHDVMCRHSRLLTDTCQECRREHYGILDYRCAVCGRTVRDAPHLAQGHEATMANDQAR